MYTLSMRKLKHADVDVSAPHVLPFSEIEFKTKLQPMRIYGRERTVLKSL